MKFAKVNCLFGHPYLRHSSIGDVLKKVRCACGSTLGHEHYDLAAPGLERCFCRKIPHIVRFKTITKPLELTLDPHSAIEALH